MVKKMGTGTLLALAIGGYLVYKKWWSPDAASSTPPPAAGNITNDTVSPLLKPLMQTSATIKAATQFAGKAVDDMTGKSDWGAWT